MKCAVIIPTHKPHLDDEEISSLHNTLMVLAARDVFIALPHNINPDYYEQFRRSHDSLTILNLEAGYLGSLENYNAMAQS